MSSGGRIKPTYFEKALSSYTNPSLPRTDPRRQIRLSAHPGAHTRLPLEERPLTRYRYRMLRRPTTDLYNMAGFVVDTIKAGAEGLIMTRGAVTSDDPQFYRMIKKTSQIFLQPHDLSPNHVISFLIVIHPDHVVDIYLNDEPTVTVEMAAKRDMAAGTKLMMSDIADIRRLRFTDVELDPADKVLYCFKVGWRFGFFFDLSRPTPLDVDALQFSLGDLYRTLTFEHIYKTLESEDDSNALFEAGWFPFIEILAPDYEPLAEAYHHKTNIDEEEARLIKSFTRERIERMTNGWWGHAPFEEKRAILEAGIGAYLQDTPEGFVLSIKTLGTEVEGLLRRQYHIDKGTAKGKVKVLLEHLIQKGTQKSGSGSSLFLPDYFLRYLHDRVFRQFDPASIAAAAPIQVGRHSVAHGAANPAAYTKRDALQLILVLDQIRFFTT